MEITTTQAAELAGVSRSCIRYALADGRIRGRKAGPAAILVDRDSLLRAVRAGVIPAKRGVKPGRNQETPAEEKALDAWTEKALEGEGNDGAN